MNWLKMSLLSLLMISGAALAKDTAHIISAQSSSSLLFSKTSSYSDDYEATFTLGTGYDYAFAGGFQLGATAAAAVYSGGSSFSLAVGPGYNFSSNDIENSFFVAFKGGFVTYHFDAQDSDTTAFLSLDMAKRFKIAENISYVPGLNVTKELGDDARDPSFSFEIVRFSLLF